MQHIVTTAAASIKTLSDIIQAVANDAPQDAFDSMAHLKEHIDQLAVLMRKWEDQTILSLSMTAVQTGREGLRAKRRREGIGDNNGYEFKSAMDRYLFGDLLLKLLLSLDCADTMPNIGVAPLSPLVDSLRSYPPAKKTAFNLYYVAGLSQQRIATMVNVSQATVSQWIRDFAAWIRDFVARVIEDGLVSNNSESKEDN